MSIKQLGKCQGSVEEMSGSVEKVSRKGQGIFQTVWSYNVPEEVNEILFCTDHEWPIKSKKVDKKHPAIEAFDKVNTHTKLFQSGS